MLHNSKVDACELKIIIWVYKTELGISKYLLHFADFLFGNNPFFSNPCSLVHNLLATKQLILDYFPLKFNRALPAIKVNGSFTLNGATKLIGLIFIET